MTKTLIAISIVFVSLGCTLPTPKKEELRNPASSLSSPETHLTPEEFAKFSSLAQAQDSNRLHILFSHARKAQILVTTFDQRLEVARGMTQVDALLKSHLYCNILDVRSINEEIEEKLFVTAKGAYQSGAETTAWFYSQLDAYASEGIPHQAAMIQTLRALNAAASSLCGSQNCVANDIKSLHSFSVPPLDNKAFAQFMRTNKSQIARTMGLKKSDLEPGSCFKNAIREPSQTQSYDWKHRNWIGSALPAGHFIFTYDDGPHNTYSQAIADSWSQAGFEKPTFFWLSKNIRAFPEIVNKINTDGYVIGSHSDRHADLGNLANAQSPEDFNSVNKKTFTSELTAVSPEEFERWKNTTLDREIIRATQHLAHAIGKKVHYFRLPYGSGTRNDQIGGRFQSLDVDHFFWRVDSLDWQDRNPESIRDRVIAQMNAVKSGIILFHDIHPQSLEATKLMIQVLQTNKSWKAVPLRALPGLKAGP